jgi:hypothetical protein
MTFVTPDYLWGRNSEHPPITDVYSLLHSYLSVHYVHLLQQSWMHYSYHNRVGTEITFPCISLTISTILKNIQSGTAYLNKFKGVMMTYTRNVHTWWSTDINASHDLVLISLDKMNSCLVWIIVASEGCSTPSTVPQHAHHTFQT